MFSAAATLASRFRGSLFLQFVFVTALCLALFLPGLGSSGLSQSEGQRAIPAWEMLQNGDYLITRLFEQPYLRKPPGMPWAIAISSSLLGSTEFAARLVSALAMTGACLLTLIFAARWFGREWAWLAAGAHALTPFFWYSARSCEIEALNNFATQAAVFVILDVFVCGGPESDKPDETSPVARKNTASVLSESAWCAALAASLFALSIVKGVASLPCVLAAWAAPVVLSGSIRSLRRPAPWIAVLVSGSAIVVLTTMIARRVALLDIQPVLQSPGKFLWDMERFWGIVLLVPRALAASLPGSLVVPLAVHFSRHAKGTGRAAPGRHQVARALSLASLIALAIYCVAGVGNVRYVMPAVFFIFPLVAYVAGELTPMVESKPQRSRRIALLVGPTAALAVAAAVFLPMEEARRARNSGIHPARRLAGVLPDECIIQADQLIETRAEVLYYTRQHARELGKSVRVLWRPDRGDHPVPDSENTLLALRTDRRSDQEIDEYAIYNDAGKLNDLEPFFVATVHKFEFTVYRKRADNRAAVTGFHQSQSLDPCGFDEK